MIRPPGWGGSSFSEAEDGNLRSQEQREAFSAALGISDRWAEVSQVHGAEVLEVKEPGVCGDGDALWTAEAGLPIAIFTADCLGIVLLGESAVGVAHGGWRGAAAGVVSNLVEAMTSAGHRPARAAIGPGIGPCCFEVGPEVIEHFPGSMTSTTWGTSSVDLVDHLSAQLPGDVEVWASGRCTKHEPGWFSHRASGTSDRMVALAWI